MFLTTLIDGARQTRELKDGSYLIGRGEMCAIRLPFPDVSERHAVLTVRSGRAVLEDLNSANGTYLNGEPVEEAVTLDGGMVVEIGGSMFRVSDGEVEEEEAKPPAAVVEERTDPYREVRRRVQEQIQHELLKQIGRAHV